jgi:hypothetical protein
MLDNVYYEHQWHSITFMLTMLAWLTLKKNKFLIIL